MKIGKCHLSQPFFLTGAAFTGFYIENSRFNEWAKTLVISDQKIYKDNAQVLLVKIKQKRITTLCVYPCWEKTLDKLMECAFNPAWAKLINY